jgi:hypothetical protein
VDTNDIYSAILLLQEHQICNDRRAKVLSQGLWQESRIALRRLAEAAASHLTNSSPDANASDQIPIFMIHVMYQAACVLLLLPSEDGMVEDVTIYKNVLRLIDSRWRLAGESSSEYFVRLSSYVWQAFT